MFVAAKEEKHAFQNLNFRQTEKTGSPASHDKNDYSKERRETARQQKSTDFSRV